MIGGLQGENGDLNNKYLKKKSKRVGPKYLKALRWISQHATWVAKFRKLEVSILRPKVDFTAAKSAFSLVRLASNGYNFFILAPIHAPFEVLDF